MASILSWCYVFQISDIIIGRYQILVINLIALGADANEGRGNEAGHSNGDGFIATRLVHTDNEIAIRS